MNINPDIIVIVIFEFSAKDKKIYTYWIFNSKTN